MADIIDFIKGDLTKSEKKQVEEFIQEHLEDIQDTSCESIEEVHDEIKVLAESFLRFIKVVEDPNTKTNPDLDFGLFLLEGRIQKIRGMLKTLFQEK
jgi:hypothetical protein